MVSDQIVNNLVDKNNLPFMLCSCFAFLFGYKILYQTFFLVISRLKFCFLSKLKKETSTLTYDHLNSALYIHYINIF